MSITVNGRHFDEYSLSDPDMDLAEYKNQEPDYGDSLSGDWFSWEDEPIILRCWKYAATYNVIYSGTFGNDHSPGATDYTYAELYDVADDEDVQAYKDRLAEIDGMPEYVDGAFDDEDTLSDECYDCGNTYRREDHDSCPYCNDTDDEGLAFDPGATLADDPAFDPYQTLAD